MGYFPQVPLSLPFDHAPFLTSSTQHIFPGRFVHHARSWSSKKSRKYLHGGHNLNSHDRLHNTSANNDAAANDVEAASAAATAAALSPYTPDAFGSYILPPDIPVGHSLVQLQCAKAHRGPGYISQRCRIASACDVQVS